MDQTIRTIVPIKVALSALLTISAAAAAQPLAQKLTFNSVQPCRIVDTRLATAGQLNASAAREFDVVGTTTNYAAQGGSASGCGIPGFAAGRPQVQAVAVNIVAVNPSAEGFLTAWPTDRAVPLASTVNFQRLIPNLNIANGVIVPVRQDAQGGDIRIVAGVANTHVLVDITGYFTRSEPRRYYLTVGAFTGGEALAACTTGYHMASLWEIFDSTTLSYNTALGMTAGDSGEGPPAHYGWMRTGTNAFNGAPSPGQPIVAGYNNCNAWQSSSAGMYGSHGTHEPGWSGPATVVSPWSVGVLTCDTGQRVWCVEDL